MKNFSICKELVLSLVKENNERYVNTESWNDYAVAVDENETSIEIWPVASRCFYITEKVFNVVQACECNAYLSIHEDGDGFIHPAINIF